MPFWQSYAGLRRYWDTRRVRRSAAPLREREFRLLFAGRAISLVGNAIAPVALAFAVLDLTGSKTDLGLDPRRAEVPLVVFLLVGGIWADRLPRNKVMVGANVVSGVAQGAIAALLITRQRQVWHLVALAARERRRVGVLLPRLGRGSSRRRCRRRCCSRRMRCSGWR